MAIVNMDSVQFYQPLLMKPSFRDENAVSEDDLPTLEELLCPTLYKGISIGEPEDFECALQTAHQRSPREYRGFANTAQSKPVCLGDSQENPVFIEDDNSDNADIEASSADSNIGGTGQRVDMCPSPMIYSSLGDEVGSADSLEEYNIEEKFCSALVNQDGMVPVRLFEPTLQPLSKSLEEPASQDVSHFVSHNAPRELSQPPLDISDKDDKREKHHQHQEAGQAGLEAYSYNSSGSGSGSGSGNSDNNDYHDEHRSDSEGPWPTKRRRLSRSSKNHTLNHTCKHHLQQSQDSCSAPAQPEFTLSRSRSSSIYNILSDEPMSSTRAEYEEWPVDGFIKRTIIGDEVRHCIEFSLKQLHKRCAPACTQHTSQAGSNRESSTPTASSSRLPTRAKGSRSGSPSQIKRTRFTEEEDAKLIDMKDKKGWSWDKIEGEFPRRTRATLQVHYSTKLKHRASSGKRPGAIKYSRRHAL